MSLTKPQLAQLRQLGEDNGVWDGNLIGKDARDELIKLGLAFKVDGAYNFITQRGRAELAACASQPDGTGKGREGRR